MCTLALLSPSPSQPEAGVMKLVPLLLQPTPLVSCIYLVTPLQHVVLGSHCQLTWGLTLGHEVSCRNLE